MRPIRLLAVIGLVAFLVHTAWSNNSLSNLSSLSTPSNSATATGSTAAQFSQQGPKLVGTGAVGGAEQGISAFLSADGNTAIVGGPFDNGDARGGVGLDEERRSLDPTRNQAGRLGRRGKRWPRQFRVSLRRRDLFQEEAWLLAGSCCSSRVQNLNEFRTCSGPD